ncbi:MAG: hypothetical protein WAM14_13125 [Candidatus Nitrosopolaris sp.]
MKKNKINNKTIRTSWFSVSMVVAFAILAISSTATTELSAAQRPGMIN